mmetsp:Transcript_48400/g.92603  ORF Transcript_48400/g.92603 Transcript_48400/m.92603 type:complete len:851 (-) Transcript_48400:670-3222(-)|eukprot:CAMPEP_0114244598 /NCGR_PEP_ID=MMETSP0058-20121206/11428_1 /TAXON_ID=36894 /ORGANISM="Pyramimonas parkeae, CCMP726" /LENGTH=850 /DNA_ID=CAMNT_0001357555 /DNA_START=178 /DNA_END=2730 /DNA_ORIENTATION=+
MAETAAAMVAATSGVRHLLQDYASFGDLVDSFMDVPVSVASEGEMVTVEDSDALLANASAGSPATHRIHPNSETGEPWDSGHMSDGAAYVTLAVLLLAAFAWGCYMLFEQNMVMKKSASYMKGGVNYDTLLEESSAETAQVVQRARDIHVTIQEGARTFLRYQIEYIGYLFLLLLVAMFFAVGSGDNWSTSWRSNVKDPDSVGSTAMGDKAPLLMNALYMTFSAIIGCVVTYAAIYFGIAISSQTNVQVALEARRGILFAYQCLIRGASSIGMFAAGIGILSLYAIEVAYQHVYGDRDNQSLYLAIAGFGLGAAFLALCARLCGVVYIKSATVGLRIVQQQMGSQAVPSDDPRNPAVITEHVGLLLNSVGGSIADLFSSFAVSVVGALVLTSTTTVDFNNDFHRTGYPLMLMGLSCISTQAALVVMGYARPVQDKRECERVLQQMVPVANLVMTVLSYFFTRVMLPEHTRSTLVTDSTPNKTVEPWEVWICVTGGIWLATLLSAAQQRFISPEHAPVRQMGESCKSGQAANLIFGMSVGYRSTIAFAVALAAVVYTCFETASYWGIGYAAVGIMGTFALSVVLEVSGAIFDNALAICSMAGLQDDIRDQVAALSLSGKSVAAISKSVSIASATLAGVAIWSAFTFTSGVEQVTDKKFLVGVFLGSMIPYWFASVVLMAIGKGASNIANEVFRQYSQLPGILDGTSCPDYKACYQISTSASLKTMKWPIVYTCALPFVIGSLLGCKCLSGSLLGLIVSGLYLGISSQTSGSAWMNTTSYISTGSDEVSAALGGKESKAYANSLMGSILGMPLSEVGPCINILIKLFAIQALLLSVFFRDNTEVGLLFEIWE